MQTKGMTTEEAELVVLMAYYFDYQVWATSEEGAWGWPSTSALDIIPLKKKRC